jgi:hypothetical protein
LKDSGTAQSLRNTVCHASQFGALIFRVASDSSVAWHQLSLRNSCSLSMAFIILLFQFSFVVFYFKSVINELMCWLIDVNFSSGRLFDNAQNDIFGGQSGKSLFASEDSWLR